MPGCELDCSFVYGPPETVPRYTKYPATVEVLAVQLRVTECWIGCVPVPDNETVAGEFVALLTNETVPEALPLVCGVNVIVTFWLAPAAIVIGRVVPVRLNPDPVKLATDTLTDDVPVFESFTVWLDVFPISTLPNATVVGDALSKYVGAAVAVPDRLTTGAELVALLAMVIVPL